MLQHRHAVPGAHGPPGAEQPGGARAYNDNVRHGVRPLSAFCRNSPNPQLFCIISHFPFCRKAAHKRTAASAPVKKGGCLQKPPRVILFSLFLLLHV